MKGKSSKVCEDIVEKVDKVMNSIEAARLTDSEYESVKQLREKLDHACQEGDEQAAVRAEGLIFSIIKDGPPMRD